MFGKLIEKHKAKKALKALQEHPVFSEVLHYSNHIMQDTSNGLGKHFSPETKAEIVQQILAEMELLLGQPDPIKAFRLRSLEYMMCSAQFDVLIMQPDTVAFEMLSGELKPHLVQLAQKHKALEEYIYGLNRTPVTQDELYDTFLMRYWVMHFRMSCYNFARRALGDFHKDMTKDWFRAAYISMCIWQEEDYRKTLGLPSLIGEDFNDSLKMIMFSSWIQRTEEGHQELRLAWERSWQDVFKEPSPLQGKALM